MSGGHPDQPERAGGEPGGPSAGDGLRFAFGTLTVFRVRVSRWDRGAARAGMLCAPVVGGAVGVAAALAGCVVLVLGGGALLAAVAAVAVPAALTRGLHLDGLADTADGLGSAKPADEALRVMKASDIGPFGVLTLLFVLLAQIAALQRLFADDWRSGAAAAVIAAVTARLALTAACRVGVPPARREGLGNAVAGSVPVRAAVITAATVLLVLAALGAAGAAGAPAGAARAVVATAAGLAAAESLLRRCRGRFGGVTGDVLGAAAETAGTTALLVLVLV